MQRPYHSQIGAIALVCLNCISGCAADSNMLRTRMAKFAIWVLVWTVSFVGCVQLALGSPIAQNTKCHFSTYSLEENAADGGSSQPDIRAYINLTSERFLKLISAETQFASAKPADADVRMIYVLNYYTYKTPPKTDNKTVFDQLGELQKNDAAARTLTSPWLQLSLTADCKLTAVFIWNKRQLIADQAFLAGVRPVIKGIVTPINDPDRFLPKEFEQSVIFLGDYSKAVPGGKAVERPSVALDEQQEIVKRFVSPKYPPDLFWFFSLIKSNKLYSDSGTFISQLIKNERQLSRHASEGQAALVIALAGRFLSDDKQHINFESIMDVGSLVDLREFENHGIEPSPLWLHFRRVK